MQLRGVPDVCQLVLSYLTERFQVAHSGIYIWNQEEGGFILWPEGVRAPRKLLIIDPFIVFITDYDRRLRREQVEAAHSPVPVALRPGVGAFFAAAGCNLAIPLVLNQSLVGVIFLEGQISLALEPELDEVCYLATMGLSNAILYARLEGILAHLEEKVQERTRELENAQSQLVHSEKMAMLGVMVAGIAHEINTPSAVIDGSVENVLKNLTYVLFHLKKASREIPEALQIPFFRLANRISIMLSARRTLVIKDTFKKKKQLLAYLESEGWPEPRELSNFLVETGLYEAVRRASDAEGPEEFLQSSLFRDFRTLKENVPADHMRFIYRYLMEIGSCARSLQNMRQAIKSIIRIVRALKHYSHLDQGGMVRTDIRESLENTIIIMNSVLKGEVEMERQFGEVVPVVCNPDELGQVWTNLITNAYHALRPQGGGKILIRTWQESAEEVGVSISDNGPGIPEAIAGRIWDPFFTTKDQGEGSGLGLGIVRGIVQKHNARILMDTKVGEGTTFKLYFPVEQSAELSHVATRGNVHQS